MTAKRSIFVGVSVFLAPVLLIVVGSKVRMSRSRPASLLSAQAPRAFTAELVDELTFPDGKTAIAEEQRILVRGAGDRLKFRSVRAGGRDTQETQIEFADGRVVDLNHTARTKSTKQFPLDEVLSRRAARQRDPARNCLVSATGGAGLGRQSISLGSSK